MWKFLSSMLPTRNILLTRMSIEDMFHPLCHIVEETPDHLFIHCPFSCIVWPNQVSSPDAKHGKHYGQKMDWNRVGIDKSLYIPSDIAHHFLLQSCYNLWCTMADQELFATLGGNLGSETNSNDHNQMHRSIYISLDCKGVSTIQAADANNTRRTDNLPPYGSSNLSNTVNYIVH